MAFLMKQPLVLERQYQTELRKVLAETKSILEQEVIQYLPQIVAESAKYDSEERFDDISSKIAALFLLAKGRVDLLLSGIALDRMVQGFANLINQFNKVQFERVVKSQIGEFRLGPDQQKISEKLNIIESGRIPPRSERQKIYKLLQTAIGVDPLRDNPKLAETMNIWVTNNINLIKSNNITFLDDAQRVVLEGVQKGLRHESIAKNVLEGTELEKGRFKTAKTRANLIARDQTNKLNGILNQIRQTETGIKKYKWRGVMDARERLTHVRLEGQIFDWAKGPPSLNGAHPGQEIQCRCLAEPVINIDELLAELDEAA